MYIQRKVKNKMINERKITNNTITQLNELKKLTTFKQEHNRIRTKAK